MTLVVQNSLTHREAVKRARDRRGSGKSNDVVEVLGEHRLPGGLVGQVVVEVRPSDKRHRAIARELVTEEEEKEENMTTTENVSKLTKIDRTPKTAARVAPPVAELPQIIEMDRLRLGDNYRKTPDPVKDAELDESVRTYGVLEPILARPIKGGLFEVVYGGRRYSSAKRVGLASLVCNVKTLTDEEALKLQLIENLQRVDVDPLEEAEAFERLRKMNHTVEEIAALINKSAGHVYQRIKLCELGEDGRKAYRAGRLSPHLALLVARVPKALQKKAAEALWDDYRKEPLSAREAQDTIRRNFMLDLDRAPFDRKSLTLVQAAGSCSACPKRTGNQTELFGDVKAKDVCTDPVCFNAKVKADGDEKIKAAAAKGSTVLSDGVTKKIFGSHGGDHVSEHTGYVAINSTYWDDSRELKIAKLVKDASKPVERFIARAPSGTVLELVKLADLKAVGALKRSSPTGSATSSSRKNEEAERRRKVATRKAITTKAIVALSAAAIKREPNKALWSFLADAFIKNAGYETHAIVLEAITGVPTKMMGRADSDVKRHSKKMSEGELRALVVMLAAGVGAHYGESVGTHVKAGAEALGVKLDKIAAEVKASAKAKKKPAAKPAKKAARK